MTQDDSLRYSGTAPLTEPFPMDRLEAWLAANVTGYRGPLAIEQFRGGQSNPTYKLIAGSGTYVLRRRPFGQLLPSAHAVDREYRAMHALQGSGVPVARVHALCQDDAVIGSAFYVMKFIEGRIFWDPRMPSLARGERAALYDAVNETIARLHAVDPDRVGLADFGKRGNYMERQISRWSRQYRASETEPIPAMDRLIEWLPQHLPPEGETRIVHGDFRVDNLIFAPDAPRVAAILDWELSTLGDPLADFAYHVMTWRLAPALFRGLAGADLATLGIPSEAEYIAAYCRRTGRADIANLDFYVVFGLFRLAAILQGVARRALEGTAANANAREVGARAGPLADQAWELARRITL
jgi:aminoglycoside phosphotransferase (APT) family kinase protein